MLREEAISKWIYPAIATMWNAKKCNEILEALEQEPCEDAISRQAAIEYLCTNMTWYDEDGETADDEEKLNAITDLVNGVPSVTSQPKTGHWVEYTRVLIPEPINRWEQAWYCSECGYGNQECEDGSAWFEWKYCPNCGCRMEGENKE